MSIETYELRLVGCSTREGEITLVDLVHIATHLQDLMDRIGRWAIGIDGPGRNPDALRELTSLRLTGIGPGSTRLTMEQGPVDTLDLAEPANLEIHARFWEVLTGMANDTPPDDAPSGVREAASSLLGALDRTAVYVEVARWRTDTHLGFRPALLHRSAWTTRVPPPSQTSTIVVGELEAADLDSRRFRIKDDAGNKLLLLRVRSTAAAARLMGARVEVTGLVTSDRGRPALDQAVIRPAVSVPDGPLGDPWA